MTRKMTSLLAAVSVVGGMAALLLAQAEQPPSTGAGMAQVANDFLKQLAPEQRQRATFAFDDPERLNWHFIPRPRKGLPLKDLSEPALAAAQALVASGLSQSGYTQALDVMSLEEILYLLEEGDRKQRRERRDPRNYYVSIFGTPGSSGRWGWRFEGHHLSLNYTLENGEVISSTPEFFGSNPALVDAGPGRSIRVLGAEEDLARQLLKLSNPDQMKKAHVDPKAPDDLRGANTPQPEVSDPAGLAAAEMSDDQRQLLVELLGEYLKNMPEPIAARRKERLMKGGLEKVYFAWWGDTERNQRHYYRIQGPTFLIEYNNTQNNANHVHSYWRDLGGDFGLPIGK